MKHHNNAMVTKEYKHHHFKCTSFKLFASLHWNDAALYHRQCMWIWFDLILYSNHIMMVQAWEKPSKFFQTSIKIVNSLERSILLFPLMTFQSSCYRYLFITTYWYNFQRQQLYFSVSSRGVKRVFVFLDYDKKKIRNFLCINAECKEITGWFARKEKKSDSSFNWKQFTTLRKNECSTINHFSLSSSFRHHQYPNRSAENTKEHAILFEKKNIINSHILGWVIEFVCV